jgi:hypothetical protein
VQRYTNFIASTTATNSTLTVLSNASCVVYVAGTLGAATLYSDNGVTPLANPFLSSATGRIDFYAANGRYDVVVSKVGYLTVTISDIELDDLLAPSGSNSVGYLPAGTGAVATTVQTKLRESVSVKDFGAVGDGVADDTAAFQNFFAALSIGTISGAIRKKSGYIPAGVYAISSNLTLTAAGYAGGFELFGDGELNSVLLFSTTTGDALTVVGNYFSLTAFAIKGTSARRAGSGNGLTINASLATTSYGGYLSRISITSHGGDALALTQIEQHTFDRIYIYDSGGRGIFLTGGAGSASWNVFENCRTAFTGGIGVEMASSAIHNTFTNLEVLAFGGTSGIRVNGRSNVLVNFDAENPTNVTGATSFAGVAITGSRHSLTGGYIGDVNTGILLTSATLCKIEQPFITNAFSGVTATDAINEDAASSANVFYLPTSYTNFTNVLTPATARSNDTLFQGSTVGIVGTWTPVLSFGGANVGITYSAQVGSYTRIGNLVFAQFDFTLSSKGVSVGGVTVAGLPIASESAMRSMANVSVLSNGTGITNLNASSTQPGTFVLNIRIQGAAGFSELTDAAFNATTRLAGSCIYRTA